MKDGETPNEYFARRILLRRQLDTHDASYTDHDVIQHFARNLTPDHSVQNSILLAKKEISLKVLEDVCVNAYGEMEMAKEMGTRDGKGHALFAADSGGRGNAGGGRAGRGGRGRGKRGEGRGSPTGQQDGLCSFYRNGN